MLTDDNAKGRPAAVTKVLDTSISAGAGSPRQDREAGE